MKCDQLTPIELECNMGKDSVTGLVNRDPWKAYDIDEVDAAIAELKSENKMLKEHIANGDVSRITWIDEATELKAENEQLKAKLETVNELVKTSKDMYDRTIESLKASHYAEMVDAGMRERRLCMALWLARALRARDIQRWWLSATFAPITERACIVWNNIEIKCLKKAEEFGG